MVIEVGGRLRGLNGWRPDFPDNRDLLYAEISKPIPIPDFVDLRLQCSPVEDQKDLGSCTANALVGNLEFLEMRAGKRPPPDLSRIFVYYNERRLEGHIHEDSGAQLRDGIKVLRAYGACLENLWPYDTTAFMLKPPMKAYADGKTRTISSYRRLLNHEDRIRCLAEGFPFVFGFTVYNNFQSEKVAKNGILDMPGVHDVVLGGHAVMAVGYDEKKKTFLVRNSWGVDWGMNGHFEMPFQYMDALADDFWTIRK